VTNEKDLEKGRTMGRKFTVPYALYQTRGVVNPHLAAQTGFGEKDLELLWEALIKAFEFDQSAARPAGSMAARALIVFKHESALGNAPAHKLFDLVKVKRVDETKPPRAFSDYEVSIDKAGVPTGVELIEMI
jgi:CRISPR-associated protein Csd2